MPYDGMPNIYDQIVGFLDDGVIAPEEVEQMSQLFLVAGVGQQAGQLDYQNKYLDYLGETLQLNGQQLAQAKQELDFQQGPYWEWYTESYFPAQQQMAADQLAMSNNQRYMSDNQLKMSGNQVTMSEHDIRKAASYAQAQEYQTDQAQIGKEVAEYQALVAMGALPQSIVLPDGRRIRGSKATYGYGGA